MKKVFALIVAATMGLSSVAFAADTAASASTTTASAATTKTLPAAKATHPHKAHNHAIPKAPVQKAQAAKKHPKNAGKKA